MQGGGMNIGSDEDARTRIIMSSSVGMSSFVQYTVSPESRSNDSMVALAGLATKVSQSKGR